MNINEDTIKNVINTNSKINQKSKLNIKNTKNLLNILIGYNETKNGVTCTVDNNGVITLNGTATGQTDFTIIGSNIFMTANFPYRLHYIYNSGSYSAGGLVLFLEDRYNNYKGISITENNQTGTHSSAVKMYDIDINLNSNGLRVYQNSSFNNLKFQIIMTQTNTEEEKTYTPYIDSSIVAEGKQIYNQPKILFNGASLGSVTLNDDRNNYTYLEIYYLDDQSFINSIKIDVHNGYSFQLQFLKSGANRGAMYLVATRYYWSSQRIMSRGTTTIYNIINGTITQNTTDDVLTIVKVIGYK